MNLYQGNAPGNQGFGSEDATNKVMQFYAGEAATRHEAAEPKAKATGPTDGAAKKAAGATKQANTTAQPKHPAIAAGA
ncbi:hypothetical protein EYC84_000070 [Monilinia fructicola]|uniref:Uncharacterized protein n=1 Tax=Monilinia fructicola TaxID=38448 RepID=A0A5M9JS96_MONFR|nr:hypothetical protein EYC84_000070 [Monilinia fructicola]